MRGRHIDRLAVVISALSLITSACLLSFAVLNSASVFVGQYIDLLVPMAVGLGFYIALVFSIALSIRGIVERRRFDRAYIAFALQTITIALLWSGILQKQVEAWNFTSRLDRRAEVVELARNGKLQPRSAGPCDCFFADLPKEYARLSAGREVLVSRHAGGFSVTFFVARSSWFGDDNYSAFIFRADDNPPRPGEEDTHFYEIRPLQKHWFFARHT